jgi:hypothetical protein
LEISGTKIKDEERSDEAAVYVASAVCAVYMLYVVSVLPEQRRVT